jgi:hypothetical protein
MLSEVNELLMALKCYPEWINDRAFPMTFEQARAIAIRLGAQTPLYDHAHPAAQCWIDRIAQAESIRDRSGRDITNQFTWEISLARAIAEANRYAGRQGATDAGSPQPDDEMLNRALAILHNMAIERTGWRRFLSRWYISAEPLRNDAANFVRYAGYRESLPDNCRLVGDREEPPWPNECE